MITRSFIFIVVSAAVSFTFGNTVTPPSEAPLFPTRNNLFTIPFEIKVDDSSELPAEVELTFSTDQGKTWFSHGRVRPENKNFLFNSSADGEYWFIFKTYGQDGLVKETRRRGPMLRVLVDTVPPKLTLSAEQKSTGEIEIQWAVEDANLVRKVPQMQISYSIAGSKNHLSNWKPVSIDPQQIQSEGTKHQGELILWPERGAGSFEIQVEVIDKAGNREMQSRTVTLSTIVKEEDSSVLTESMQSTFQQSGKPQSLKSLSEAIPKRMKTPPPYPVDQSATEQSATALTAKPLSVPLNPPRPTVQTNSKPIPNRIAGLSTINESLKSFSEVLPSAREGERHSTGIVLTPTREETESELQADNASGNDSMFVGPLIFPEDAAGGGSFSVGSPQATIPTGSNFKGTLELSLIAPEKDSSDDDWEGGPILSIPNSKYAPPSFDLEEPELAEESPELFEQPEERNDPPSVAMKAVEKSNAFIRITKISHLRDLRLSQVLVKWETAGDSWTGSENAKVHIFRGPSQKGPWTPIAVYQENTGTYAWTVSQADRDPFYILLQSEDVTEENDKELVSDWTMQPIQLPAAVFNKG